MADAEQYQPSAEELVAAIKEIKEKNPEFGIKRVYTELKVRDMCRCCLFRFRAAFARDASIAEVRREWVEEDSIGSEPCAPQCNAACTGPRWCGGRRVWIQRERAARASDERV